MDYTFRCMILEVGWTIVLRAMFPAILPTSLENPKTGANDMKHLKYLLFLTDADGWSVPTDATITSGQGTTSITVDIV